MLACYLPVKFPIVCSPTLATCARRIPAVLPKFNIKFSRVSLDKLALPCYNMGVMRGENPTRKEGQKMERYDYREEMAKDIRAYIEEDYSTEEIAEKLAYERDDWETELYDDMMVADSVTGNASGSYTFHTWQAEENICHNLDLLGEAIEEFGGEFDVLIEGAETCDVTIRCYLLSEVLNEVLDEMESDYEEEIEKVRNGEEEDEEEKDEE